jgi:Mg2+ and Co2+ transporter CorA
MCSCYEESEKELDVEEILLSLIDSIRENKREAKLSHEGWDTAIEDSLEWKRKYRNLERTNEELRKENVRLLDIIAGKEKVIEYFKNAFSELVCNDKYSFMQHDEKCEDMVVCAMAKKILKKFRELNEKI